mmetsp:Transcript_2344/g.3394  ORF Transcript_2344/g.3394 Transcript_2344/m.3394 type:complete len:515 (+) Transcript_2344:71-1615(+)
MEEKKRKDEVQRDKTPKKKKSDSRPSTPKVEVHNITEEDLNEDLIDDIGGEMGMRNESPLASRLYTPDKMLMGRRHGQEPTLGSSNRRPPQIKNEIVETTSRCHTTPQKQRRENLNHDSTLNSKKRNQPSSTTTTTTRRTTKNSEDMVSSSDETPMMLDETHNMEQSNLTQMAEHIHSDTSEESSHFYISPNPEKRRKSPESGSTTTSAFETSWEETPPTIDHEQEIHIPTPTSPFTNTKYRRTRRSPGRPIENMTRKVVNYTSRRRKTKKKVNSSKKYRSSTHSANENYELGKSFYETSQFTNSLGYLKRYILLQMDRFPKDVIADENLCSHKELLNRHIPNTSIEVIQEVRFRLGESAYMIGQIYRKHKDNTRKALKYYRIATNFSNKDACYQLGNIYKRCRHFMHARRYFEMAKDHAGAQTNLGIMYHYGQGVDQNYQYATKMFQIAADKDYPRALECIGVMYFNGQGVTRHFPTALSYYERAFELGLVRTSRVISRLKSRILKETCICNL